MNDTKEKLTLELHEISENGYDVTEGKVFDMVKQMLSHIGDPDPILRDKLIYSTLWTWIVKLNYLCNEELVFVLEKCLDKEHLFFNIEIKDDTSVLTRSFSALVIALVLYRHRRQPFLTTELFLHTKECLLGYLSKECDLRGYTHVYGWAHAAAHCADALDELSACPECNQKPSMEILEAVTKLLHNGSNILFHAEDYRIATIAQTILEREQVPLSDFVEWLKRLIPLFDREREYESYINKLNTVGFVRCLYFKALRAGCDDSIIDTLIELEKQLS